MSLRAVSLNGMSYQGVTWITENSLYNDWEVAIYLDQAVENTTQYPMDQKMRTR